MHICGVGGSVRRVEEKGMDKKQNIPVTSPLLPDLEEFEGKLSEIWDAGWITNNGSFHKELERKLSEYLKVPYLSLFTNGTPNEDVGNSILPQEVIDLNR